jgi:thiol-disulfide isomerase/thioredoxin
MRLARMARGSATALLFVLAVAKAAPVHADDNVGAKIDIIELRQSDESLRATYAKGKRMMLPRLLLLDAQGRPLLVEVGARGGVGHRLAAALARDKPLDTPITLDLALTEVVNGDGKSVVATDLPKADGYVVDYWAKWCAPCRELARDVESQLKRWEGKHVVWLKIESDPEKLPERKKH